MWTGGGAGGRLDPASGVRWRIGGPLRWSELRDADDPETRALAVLGDRWALHLLSQCLAGTARFDQLQRRYGLSRSIVADRLKLFVEEGILERCDADVARHGYRLTDKGRALTPLFAAIKTWTQDHVATPRAGSTRRARPRSAPPEPRSPE
ncbi:winged helix-turn-helix transcriptional regulator [Caulobacter sp. KR2-114]|uniref:winged helix-turn-helix transcriptional regulator n=1 Tax=Caulobacter sp. KR2-114 TaxID=3400912 RepID=UPI003C0CA347